MKDLFVLQHADHEGPGSIEEWAENRGLNLIVWRVDQDAAPPAVPGSEPLVVVLGGPMNLSQEEFYPWLKEEKRFLFRQLNKRGKLLGLCLGGQLIANILGAEVGPQPEKEIGWFPIEWRPEALDHPIFQDMEPQMTVLHWHGQTFSLPIAARPLAFSAACANQGFIWKDRALALQFHLEANSTWLRHMVAGNATDLEGQGPWIQDRATIIDGAHAPVNKMALFTIMDRFFLGRYKSVSE